MTKTESSWIKRRLKDAGRIALALAGAAAFAYFAWNPQPAPPLPGAKQVTAPAAASATPLKRKETP